MFTVRVKPSAIETNGAVAEAVEDRGRRWRFASKPEAVAFVEECNGTGNRVRLQAVAPQDPDDVDGYVIRFPQRHVDRPKRRDGSRWTWDVGANQYGELGRALVFGGYGLAPGLKRYLAEQLDACETDSGLRVIADPDLGAAIPEPPAWEPDCLIIGEGKAGGARFFCEIKAGNGSLERAQKASMQTVARYHHALKIQVDLADLPDEYAVRVTEVHPA